jgi:hypothetical protein
MDHHQSRHTHNNNNNYSNDDARWVKIEKKINVAISRNIVCIDALYLTRSLNIMLYHWKRMLSSSGGRMQKYFTEFSKIFTGYSK